MKRACPKRSQICIWLLYFFVVFVVSNAALAVMMDEQDLVFREDSERVSWPSVSSLCDNIETVSDSGDKITLRYLNRIATANKTLVSLHFGLVTSWLQQEIFYPPGSAEVELVAEKFVQLKFHLPVVDKYKAKLFCIATGSDAVSARELEAQASRKFDVKLAISDFDENREYSQLRCHYKDEFPRRWCEGRNIPYFDDHVFFLTPAKFQFPEPFIVPGARAPPFDREVDRLNLEPIPITFKASTLPRSLEEVTDVCYITGVFHNAQMIWHAVFDFMIPFYHFMKILAGPDTVLTRRIYFRSDSLWTCLPLMRAFSYMGAKTLADTHPQMLMRTAIIGMEKLEANPDPKRTVDESINFSYQFDRSTALGMREDILDALHIANEPIDNENPRVIVIRRGLNRDIENMDQVIDVITKGCPQCNVHSVHFDNIDIAEQVRIVSQASVLLGMHGSGLTHTVWMAESQPDRPTHLIEVLPYNYSCRPWYHTAANVSGVQYHSVMNRKPPPLPAANAELLQTCWANPNICATHMCHDYLRDQRTTVDLDVFNETWMRVVATFPNK